MSKNRITNFEEYYGQKVADGMFYKNIIKKYGYTNYMLAKITGVSHHYINAAIKLYDMSLQDAIEDRKFNWQTELVEPDFVKNFINPIVTEPTELEKEKAIFYMTSKF